MAWCVNRWSRGVTRQGLQRALTAIAMTLTFRSLKRQNPSKFVANTHPLVSTAWHVRSRVWPTETSVCRQEFAVTRGGEHD